MVDLTPAIAEYAAILYAYGPEISLLTAVFSLGVFVVSVWMTRVALSREPWVVRFGWAFGVLAIFYFIRVGSPDSSWADAERYFEEVVGSSLVNLLFLSAAIHLLGKQGTVTRRQWSLVTALAVSSAFFEATHAWYPAHRVPDAIVSAGCMGVVGWALASNIGFRHRIFVAYLTFTGPLIYALLNLMYAANPLVSTGVVWPSLTTALSVALERISDVRSFEPDPLKALDSTVFALALLAKMMLFVGPIALLLRMWTIIHPDKTRQLMTGITDGRVEPISDEGVLRSIGMGCGADLVTLAFKLPDPDGNRVGWWRWIRSPSAGGPISGFDTYVLPSPNASVVSYVLSKGGEMQSTDIKKGDPEVSSRYWAYVPGMNSLVTLPIKFHGAVVGAMNIEWRAQKGYEPTSLARFRQLATLIAPGVHATRQLVALERLGNRFSLLALRRAQSEQSPAGAITKALHNALTPLGSGLILEAGFAPMFFICGDDVDNPKPTMGNVTDMRAALNMLLLPERDLTIVSTDLKIEVEPGIETRLGEIALAIRPDRDEMTRPTLASDLLHRKAVAALVTDAVLEVARVRFLEILEEFDARLITARLTTRDAWFDAVKVAGHAAQFRWVVAEWPEQEDDGHMLGANDHCELVSRLKAQAGQSNGKRATSIKLDQPCDGAHHVCILWLGSSKARVWCGIANPDFELEPQRQPTASLHLATWPWHVFAEDLAIAADSGLGRVMIEELRAESGHSQRLVIAAIAINANVHELKNLTRNLRSEVYNLEESQRIGTLSMEDLPPRIARLTRSFYALDRLATELNGVACLPKTRPCEVLRVTRYTCDLFESVLRQNAIGVAIDVPEDLLADVPFDVAANAVVNLMGNSIDVLSPGGGTIRIYAEVQGVNLRWHVTDTGPGIPPELVEKIFEPEFTTKPEHSGRGLNIMRRQLNYNRGNIVLVGSEPGATHFMITVPAVRG